MVSARRLHLVMTVTWALLLAPTLFWWRNSIFWVATMSLYANVVGHWSAYQAAKAEKAEHAAASPAELKRIEAKLDTLLRREHERRP